MRDPDIDIRGSGAWSSRPLDKGGGGGTVTQEIFRPSGLQFGLTIRGGGGLALEGYTVNSRVNKVY